MADRAASLRRAGSSLLKLLHLRAELDGLRVERDALEAEVVRAVDRLRPADMVPLFPRAPQEAQS